MESFTKKVRLKIYYHLLSLKNFHLNSRIWVILKVYQLINLNNRHLINNNLSYSNNNSSSNNNNSSSSNIQEVANKGLLQYLWMMKSLEITLDN